MFTHDYLLKQVEEVVKATKEVFVNEMPSESADQKLLEIKVCLIGPIIDEKLLISDWVN